MVSKAGTSMGADLRSCKVSPIADGAEWLPENDDVGEIDMYQIGGARGGDRDAVVVDEVADGT